MINDEALFTHSLSFTTVNDIVKRAQQQEIYYEVFPFEGNRIVLKEDQSWATALFDAETPPGNVGVSEWTLEKRHSKTK